MIYIVRHGQTDWNLKGINQGQTDIGLNETGIEQAEALGNKLKNICFDVVYSSPLKRALKTASIIYNGNIIVDERLLERDNGELEGTNKNKSVVDFSDPNDTRFGIEHLPAFRKRISEFLEEIVIKHRGKNVLIVTHGGVSIYAKCYFDGEPENGDYSQYIIKNSNFLQFDND